MKRPLLPAGVDQATRRRIIFGSTLGVSALLVLALVLILNYLSFRHYQRWDWTRSELYTLSDKTESILAGLQRDVSVVVFMEDQSPLYAPTRELLSRYAAASPKVQVSYFDPARNPARAEQLLKQYQMQRAAVVFESGQDKRVVQADDLADYDYSAMQMGGAPELKGFKGEQKFTGAILELVEAKKPTVLFTTGHGERSLDGFDPRGLGNLQRALTNAGFVPEEWASLGKTAVPPDTGAVVVAGPTAAFAPPELELLSRHLTAGGRLLVLVDPELSPADAAAQGGLAAWLAGWGVALQGDVVVDPDNTVPFFGDETIYAGDYAAQPAVDALRERRIPVIVSLARSVRAAKAPEKATVTELIKTGAGGWGELDLANAASGIRKDPQDLAGPVALAAAVELNAAAASPLTEEGMPAPAPTPAAGPKGRLVVVGDADFASNALLGQAGNADLLTNTLNWMVERETHLGIAPKEPEQVRLSLTSQQRWLNFWLVVFGLPGAALAAGIAITVKRRR
jgi:hypothetical protein